MRALFFPVGELPATVYWRRRLFVVVGLAVGVGVGGYCVNHIAQPPKQATKSVLNTISESDRVAGNTTSDVAAANASTTATGATSQRCTAADVQITVSADRAQYTAGQQAQLVLVVKNISDRVCRIDVGTEAQEMLVRQRNQVVWSSDHCQEKASSSMQTARPGQELTAKLTWPLTTSAPGCTGQKQPLLPGSYELSARVGNFLSKAASFQVAAASGQ